MTIDADTPLPESPEPPPPAWEYKAHMLTILPDVNWEEWQELWASVDRIGRSNSFWTGDALLAGQRFPEWTQVVDAAYIHQQRGPMWVCSRIPPARRRVSLSYSAHKEAAALEPGEQDELLDLAEANRWGSREIREEINRRKLSAAGRNAPPGERIEKDTDPAPRPNGGAAPEDGPAGSTWNKPESSAPPQERPEPPEPSHHPEPAPPLPALAAGDRATELRAIIAALRAAANDLALERIDPTICRDLNARIARAVPGSRPDPLPNTDVGLKLIPSDWLPDMKLGGGEEVFGGRPWSVELRKKTGNREQRAIGHGPSLPCAVIEAAISALLSDMGAG